MDKGEDYRVWCKRVLFMVQILVLVSMLITSIVNIIMKTGNLSLWTALLGSSLGYLLPTPRFRSNKHEERKSTTDVSAPSSIVT